MSKKGILTLTSFSQTGENLLVTICLNRFSSSRHTPLWYIALFTISHFLLLILRTPDNGEKANLEIFY